MSDLNSGKQWSAVDLQHLQDCLQDGMPVEEIAACLMRDVEEVERVLELLGDGRRPAFRLRHASKHVSGTWAADDYDVMSGDRVVGRIFRSHFGPKDKPWMWAMPGVVVMSDLANHGYAPTLKEAKAAFAEHWRKWMALNPS
jgi:hypothetical protein